MLLPIVVPLDVKMDSSLQGGSSSTLYHIVGALLYPSTLALLSTIGLGYLRALLM
jgi:hypothetical protein